MSGFTTEELWGTGSAAAGPAASAPQVKSGYTTEELWGPQTPQAPVSRFDAPTVPLPFQSARPTGVPTMSPEALGEGTGSSLSGPPSLPGEGAMPPTKPAGPRQVPQGLGEVMGSSFERGQHALVQSVYAMPLGAVSRSLSNLTGIEAKLASGTKPEAIPDAEDVMGVRWMDQAQRNELRGHLTKSLQKAALNVASKEVDIRSIPQHPNVQAAMASKSFGEFWNHFKNDPITIIAGIGSESVPQMVPGLAAAAVAGPIAGASAAAASVGVGSYATTYMADIIDSLREAKVDVTNPEAIRQAMMNPKLVEEIGRKAHAHATPVAALDALSMGVASRGLLPARTLAERPTARMLAETGVQLPVQGGAGGFGEFLGQTAAGGPYKPADIAGEVVGEAFGAPLELAVGALSRGRAKLRASTRTMRALEALREAAGMTDEELHKVLSGDTQGPVYEPPAPGMVRMFSGTDGVNEWTNKNEDFAREKLKKGDNVGWVDVPQNDPAVMSGKLSPAQEGQLQPLPNLDASLLETATTAATMAPLEQQLPSMVPTPQGSANVREALGGKPNLANAPAQKVEGTMLPQVAVVNDHFQLTAAPRDAAAADLAYTKARADVNLKEIEYGNFRQKITSKTHIVTNADLRKLNELGRELLALTNKRDQIQAALRDFKAGFAPAPTRMQKFNDGIYVDPSVAKAAQGQKFGDINSNLEANAIATTIAAQRLAQKLGIRSKIQFEVHQGALQPAAHIAQAAHLRNGVFNIRVSVDSHRVMGMDRVGALATLQASLMHELGHVIMWERWANASVETKTLIQAAYDKYLASIDAEQPVHAVMAARMSAAAMKYFSYSTTAPMSQHTIAQQIYWMSFTEWFAENVARWATTDAKPVSIIEKHFKSIAEAILNFYTKFVMQWNIGKTSAEKNYFKAPTELSSWLNHFLEHAPELAQDIYTEKAISDMENAGKVMPPGVPVVPGGPSTVLPKTIVQKGVPPGTPIPPNNQPPGSPPGGPPPPAGPGGPQPGGPAQAALAQMGAHADRIHWVYKYLAGLDQLAKANPLFRPLTRYYERVMAMHREEAAIHELATRVGKAWRNLGAQSENLTAFLEDLTLMTYRSTQEKAAGVERHPTQGELATLVRQHKLDAAGQKVAGDIKKMFDWFLRMNRDLAVSEAQKYITDPAQLLAKINEIDQSVKRMASRPYFPFMRFGDHFVLVRDAANQVVSFHTVERRGFQSAKSRQEVLRKELESKLAPGQYVTVGVLPEEAAHYVGMPPHMLEVMKNKLVLTKAQTDALNQLMLAQSPALSFKHRFQNKAYVPGYSLDFQRSFARYFFHGARYYARMKHSDALNGFIAEAKSKEMNSVKANEIGAYMQDHFDKTVVDGRNEWGIVKGLMFQWGLGYSLAAATQNLSQIPMVALPFFGAKFGDAKAISAIARAISDIDKIYKGKKDYPHYKNSSHDFVLRALDYGIRMGRISEAQAADLAGMAGGGNLIKGIGGNKAERFWIAFQEKGAWMFEMAEQFNRRVTYRAALQLALENPNSKGVKEALKVFGDEHASLQLQGFTEAEATALVTAAYATEQTQYVYSRYARPKIFRGKIGGTVFIFAKYLQSTLFLMAQNPKDVFPRMLLVGMAVYGLGGTPGYEELRDILKAVAARLYGKHFNLDYEIQRFILNIAGGKVPPDLVLHGFARKGLGIPAALDMLGSLWTGTPGRGLDSKVTHSRNVPYPVLDRSKALGLSHILPASPGNLLYPTKNPSEQVVKEMQKAGGAAFSVGANIANFLVDDKLEMSDPKRWERAIPRQLAAMFGAGRRAYEGRERTREPAAAASTVVPYNLRDTEHVMELIAIGLGYRTAREAEAYDRIMYEQESIKFYELMKERMHRQWSTAVQGKVKEEIQNVNAEIKRYNASLPAWAKPMMVTPESLEKSHEKRVETRVKRTLGIPLKESHSLIAQEARRLFPGAKDIRVPPPAED